MMIDFFYIRSSNSGQQKLYKEEQSGGFQEKDKDYFLQCVFRQQREGQENILPTTANEHLGSGQNVSGWGDYQDHGS